MTPHRALIVIDVQNEYFDGPLEIQYPPREDSLQQVLAAIDVAVAQGVPVVLVRHEAPAGSPVFAAGSVGAQLHPELEARVGQGISQISKSFSSVFAGTGLAELLQEQGVDTVTLVGHMTNNCVLASAAGAEPLGLTVEVLQDAVGAIHLSNEAGTVSAQQVHQTLMTLLHSNFAAVASTDDWTQAVVNGAALPGSNLGVSAVTGRTILT